MKEAYAGDQPDYPVDSEYSNTAFQNNQQTRCQNQKGGPTTHSSTFQTMRSQMRKNGENRALQMPLMSEKLLRSMMQSNRSYSNNSVVMLTGSLAKTLNAETHHPGQAHEMKSAKAQGKGKAKRPQTRSSTDMQNSVKQTGSEDTAQLNMQAKVEDEPAEQSPQKSQKQAQLKSQKGQPQPRFVSHAAFLKQSFKVLPQSEPASLSSGQPRQTLALCFEGLCAIANPLAFSFETEDKASSSLQVRADLIEALDSFKKATNNSVTIILYTYLSEEAFQTRVASKPALSALFADENCLVERIIFLSGFQHGQYSRDQLAVPPNFLPPETRELLWVHPLDLDVNEVLSKLKQKNYERLLFADGFRTVRCLPHVALTESKSNVAEFTLLVSSLEFDLEVGKSSSMLAIMKTIQSFYFLGKITHLISQNAKIKHELVPVAIQKGLVPTPVHQSICDKLKQRAKPTITFSFEKSFKTIQEHMLLSLVAFEASPHCFFAEEPLVSGNCAGKALLPQTSPRYARMNERNALALLPNQHAKARNQLVRVEQLRTRMLKEKGYNLPDPQLLSKLEPTASILEVVVGGVISTTQNQKPSKETDPKNSVQTAGGIQVPSQPATASYLQPTISSQGLFAGITYSREQLENQSAGVQTLQGERLHANQLNSMVSPRNLFRTLCRELKNSNREAARNIRQYARSKESLLEQKQSVNRTVEKPSACKVLVLDGWLIEKFPLLKLA